MESQVNETCGALLAVGLAVNPTNRLPSTARRVMAGAAFSALRVRARMPVRTAASSGSIGISHKIALLVSKRPLPLQLVDIADRDRTEAPIDIEDDRQADRRLRSRDRDSNQHEHLRLHG